MKKNSTDEKLSKIAKLCQEAVEEQKKRESKLGYGLDDYTEGRIVGAANLARKIIREIKEIN
jgi:hypothetical protein